MSTSTLLIVGVSFGHLMFSSARGQDVIATFDGISSGQSFVTNAADVDSDGVSDIVIAEPGLIGGRIAVYSGLTFAQLYDIQMYLTCNQGVGFGSSISSIGDFNGDGIPDLLIAAPSDRPPGSCHLFSAGHILVINGLTGALLFEVYGSNPNASLGSWAEGLGDVNGDGYADVGAGGAYGGGQNYAKVFLGPDGTVLREHAGQGYYPASIDRVGDINQDGKSDYIVGWMQDSTVAAFAGMATVFSGATGEALHTVYGEKGYGDGGVGDHLGRSVAGLGDITGDGIPDFAVGAPGEFSISWARVPGFCRVYSGLDASIVWHFAPPTPADNWLLGYGVRGGGDINGDGVPDIMIGAPYDTDVPPLHEQGSIAAYSGHTGTVLWKRYGGEATTSIGREEQMAILGDLNQDGIQEWAYGDPVLANYDGRVTVYAGSSGDALRICAATANSTGRIARIATHGPISLGNQDFALTVSGAVSGQFGLFFYGSTEVDLPFGNGKRCAGGDLYRFAPPKQIDSLGGARHEVDFASPPAGSGSGAWTSGSTWIQQFWYRDPAAGGSSFNLSDALAISFLP